MKETFKSADAVGSLSKANDIVRINNWKMCIFDQYLYLCKIDIDDFVLTFITNLIYCEI